jgi:hypothetical protein
MIRKNRLNANRKDFKDDIDRLFEKFGLSETNIFNIILK